MTASAKARVARLGAPKPTFTNETRRHWSDLRKGKCWRPPVITKQQMQMIKDHAAQRGPLSATDIAPYVKKRARSSIDANASSYESGNGRMVRKDCIWFKVIAKETGFSYHIVKEVLSGRFNRYD